MHVLITVGDQTQRGPHKRIKTEWVLHPGACVECIRWRYEFQAAKTTGRVGEDPLSGWELIPDVDILSVSVLGSSRRLSSDTSAVPAFQQLLLETPHGAMIEGGLSSHMVTPSDQPQGGFSCIHFPQVKSSSCAPYPLPCSPSPPSHLSLSLSLSHTHTHTLTHSLRSLCPASFCPHLLCGGE